MLQHRERERERERDGTAGYILSKEWFSPDGIIVVVSRWWAMWSDTLDDILLKNERLRALFETREAHSTEIE